MNVRLISITECKIPEIPSVDELIAFCARVSSPQNQTNFETAPKLIAYLIKHKHWSPFEMAGMCVEITTSRAIAQQILRHRSFSFQEFSQRYATATAFEPIELRRQGTKNRQGGEEVIDPGIINPNGTDCIASDAIDRHLIASKYLYDNLIEAGVAKECARFVLPLTTQTTLYMNGTVRSWIHYLEQRLDNHAQKEHRLIAEEIQGIFKEQYPKTSQALGWIV